MELHAEHLQTFVEELGFISGPPLTRVSLGEGESSRMLPLTCSVKGTSLEDGDVSLLL